MSSEYEHEPQIPGEDAATGDGKQVKGIIYPQHPGKGCRPWIAVLRIAYYLTQL